MSGTRLESVGAEGGEMRELCNWAAILAGGDGSRLRAFTRLVAGDDRPKQFCRLFGRDSLLNETRARLCLNVEPANTLCVVSRPHEHFYRYELSDMPRSHIVEQPSNRGTTAALAAAIVRARRLAHDCVIGFFPADHHYRDVCAFRRTTAAAYAAAHADPDRVFLIGAEATEPEIEYGWIQPGDRLDLPRVSPTRRASVRAVEAFHEEPSTEAAVDLFARRCLWNTFVMVGHLGAFEELLASTRPDIWAAFTPARTALAIDEPAILQSIYAVLPASDFSREVITAAPERLGVVSLPAAGWIDLGRPSRVLDVLADRSLRSPRPRLAAS
jgi:mannose-1-phosphate guanylyltransferase